MLNNDKSWLHLTELTSLFILENFPTKRNMCPLIVAKWISLFYLIEYVQAAILKENKYSSTLDHNLF